MGFALDHADASGDVVGVLKESLLVPETPIHGKDVHEDTLVYTVCICNDSLLFRFLHLYIYIHIIESQYIYIYIYMYPFEH